jgi:hypothetical protein
MLAAMTLSLFVALEGSSNSLPDNLLASEMEAQLTVESLPSFLRRTRRRAHSTVATSYTCTWPLSEYCDCLDCRAPRQLLLSELTSIAP